MIVFKEELLGRIRTLLTALPAAAQADVMENDIGMIERQLERYRRRLEYWYERQWILEGLQIDDETRTITFRDKSVTFSKREYQLLILLLGRSPIFVSAKQLLVQAWHDSRLPEETLRTYIGRVRTKLLGLGLEAEIQNRPRRGYALIFQDKPRKAD